MKPNFALSLSQSGIELLHRNADAWTLVGRAKLEAEDFADQVALLRSTATGLDPSGLRCKLVIPDDVVKYLSIDTGMLSDSERQEAAKEALKDATPYSLDDLRFDIRADGPITHIAAVAEETLTEAESFATDHRMHPVSFVGAAAGSDFPGEPFFGHTEGAKALLEPDEAIDPDEMQTSTKSATVADVSQIIPDHQEGPDPEQDTVNFVSRRTVPTFRTGTPTDDLTEGLVGVSKGAVPGFGEPEEDFAAAESPTAKRPSTAALHNPVRKPTLTPEAERMAVFGTQSDTGRSEFKRRVAMVAAVVVLVPIGIAAFASGAVNTTFSLIFDRSSANPPAAQFAAPLQPELLQRPSAEQSPEVAIELASLTPELTDEDAAVLEALRSPPLAEVTPQVPPTPNEVQSSYAVTGIWPVAPDVPSPPPLVDLDDLYITSIDPINPDFDAIALPAVKSYKFDATLSEPASPAPAGTRFALDDRGMVVPSASGALNPDGVRIFSGPPPVRQPDNLLRIEEPGEDLSLRLALAELRPRARPDDLIERNERASLSGLTRSELSQLRPRLRPQSAQENAAAAASLVSLDGDTNGAALIQPNDENSFDGETSRAVAASLRPGTRPNNFSEIVARAQRAKAAAAAPAPAPVATAAAVAPRAVNPSIPSSASVSREATVKNAINLRRVNLIGVYGTPSSRRALVRLGNGRFRKVEVGDRIDGGKVSAIGDSELRYQKKGRAYVLKMPKG